MKTTVEISDSLLDSARRVAQREHTTLRALVEEGLRHALRQRRRAGAFTLRRASFKGQGLRPELSGTGWDTIRDIAYRGHGA
ncbi:MAG: type II toxin-antitoxin system VapB family antitoxin [Acidobacteria bacterium]|nr:type II toxin-antitoxin system VapB family antitoxin [Acidobacteriota bacterium]